jgi:hypothetical protein
MSQQAFADFYSQYLVQDPTLKASLEGISDPVAFGTAAVEAGRKAGFAFTEDDVKMVVHASIAEQAGHGGELSTEQLESVAGGVSMSFPPTVNLGSLGALSTIRTAPSFNPGKLNMSTVMCPW